MKVELCDLLSEWGKVFLQGTMNADEEYPSEFCTYHVSDSDLDGYYSNEADRVVWSVSVAYYTNDARKILTEPPKIIKKLKAAGYMPQGVGNDLLTDDKYHVGWVMEFLKEEQTSTYKGE